MADLHVNSSASTSGGLPGGNDTIGDGSSGAPFLTIEKALENYRDTAETPEWIADELVIHLANGGATQPAYGTGGLDLSSLLFKEGGTLTIQAFNLPPGFFLLYPPPIGQDQYNAWTYPLPQLPPIDFGGKAGEVRLVGLNISGGGGTIFGELPFYGVRGMGGHATIMSCRFSSNTYGLFTYDAFCMVVGCLFDQNQVGVFAFHNSIMLLAGANAVTNSKEIGVCAAVNSTIAVPTMAGPGESAPEELSVLDIRTSEARKEYVALKAMVRGQILLDGDVPGLGTGAPIPGFIRIVKDSGYDHEEYRGVVLESMGMLMGSRNVQFKVSTTQSVGYPINYGSTAFDTSNDDAAAEVDSIPPERQFVVATEQGAVAVE